MINLSPLDTQRFGVKTARADYTTTNDISVAENFCDQHSVRLLIARCASDSIPLIHQLETADFRLMETLIYYTFRFHEKIIIPEIEKDSCTIRALHAGEADKIKHIAQEAFRNYRFGHYHADPNLDKVQCDAAYADWAYRACLFKEVADHVGVAESEGETIGFIALQKNRILLNAVKPTHQKKGIYRHLVRYALSYLQAENAVATVATSIHNLAPQKVWGRLGFEPERSVYTFHKWYS